MDASLLSLVLIGKTGLNPIILGLVISITLHITGVFANMISGVFSDKFGSKNVLIIFAFISSIFSFLMGWIQVFLVNYFTDIFSI